MKWQSQLPRRYSVYGQDGGSTFGLLGHVVIEAPVGCIMSDAFATHWLHRRFGTYIAIDHKSETVALAADAARKFVESKNPSR